MDEEQIYQSELKEQVKRRQTLAVSHHIQAKKQRLAMNKNTLADLYPEDGHLGMDKYKTKGMGRHHDNKDQFTKVNKNDFDDDEYESHDSNMTPKHFLPSIKDIGKSPLDVKFRGNPDKIEIREAGEDMENTRKIQFKEKEERNDKRSQKNKQFFSMPEKNREYPKCNTNGNIVKSYCELTREFMTCSSLCHELLVE
jgi:hypothetical protein